MVNSRCHREPCPGRSIATVVAGPQDLHHQKPHLSVGHTPMRERNRGCSLSTETGDINHGVSTRWVSVRKRDTTSP